MLSVSDVERLAKAGVAITFSDVQYQIQRDPEEVVRVASLADSFWERWRRANPPDYRTFGGPTFGIYASEYGDKVYVYVHPTDSEPFILEDDKHLYPSDALMAKLHLREKSK